jgi:hypothetical protein
MAGLNHTTTYLEHTSQGNFDSMKENDKFGLKYLI